MLRSVALECKLSASEISMLRESQHPIKPRVRVIIDNDFGGDPDGLFQLAHHLLSPSVEVRAIIGSHHYKSGFYGAPGTVEQAVKEASELLDVMRLTGQYSVLSGAHESLTAPDRPIVSEAARAIVAEAMRDDVQTPLYLACGAGLTNAASAYLLEPRIARRLTLVWIGGPEHKGVPPPPGKRRTEYNLGIDPKAAQTVFQRSDLPLWQVPRNAYRQALVSYFELTHRLGAESPLTGFLLGRLQELMRRAGRSLGEAYVLGDSPLVLLTALQSSWEMAPSSSQYMDVPAPRISDAGDYEEDPSGRTIRVYSVLDTRLMFEDFYAKVSLWRLTPPPKK